MYRHRSRNVRAGYTACARTLGSRQAATAALDEEIDRVQAIIKMLDAQKQRALRLFTIAEADDGDVKRELARINKLHGHARARLAELEGRQAVSAQFEPMAEKVARYCALMRDRLNDLSFEQKREVLEALQAQFTLAKDGTLRILLVLPSASEGDSYITLATCIGMITCWYPLGAPAGLMMPGELAC